LLVVPPGALEGDLPAPLFPVSAEPEDEPPVALPLPELPMPEPDPDADEPAELGEELPMPDEEPMPPPALLMFTPRALAVLSSMRPVTDKLLDF
jgi:hypothetical protein